MRHPTESVVGLPLWTSQRARLALIAVHLPIFAVLPVDAVLYYWDGGPSGAVTTYSAIGVALLIAELQLRHSLATAEGHRPAGAMVTLTALVVLGVAPMPWLGWMWLFSGVFVAASALMLAPRVVGAGFWVALLAADFYGVFFSELRDPSIGTSIESYVYDVLIYSVIIACIAGSTQLARILDELHRSRTELAEMSVTSERLRIARDLHDLLGQSLSAVSLKGDLAAALLERDPAAARAEIESLTDTARTALRDVRAVATAPEEMRLDTELDGARTLLGAAGIALSVDVDLDGADAAREPLGWVVREGVTNIVRHSAATRVTIAGHRRAGRITLSIRNDGAGPSGPPGSGLEGLRARSAASAGTLVAGRADDGWFDLTVDIPAGTTGEAG